MYAAIHYCIFGMVSILDSSVVDRHVIAEKIADLALNNNHSNYGKILPLNFTMFTQHKYYSIVFIYRIKMA